MDRQPPRDPAEREMVFCHLCENEWYRDEHGLICPQPDCGSDFTEVIEADHDPRADLMLPHEDSDSDHAPNINWRNAPDPDEDNINEFQWQSSGPGRFTVHGTYYRNVPNPQQRGDPTQAHGVPGGNPNYQENIANSFMSMLQGILSNNGRTPHEENPGVGQQQQQNTGQLPGGPQVHTVHGGGPGHRFTYTSTTHLSPRGGNNAHVEPVDDLNAILGAMFGPPNGPQVPGRPGQPGQPGQPGLQPVLNPLAAIFGQILNPTMIHGDAVHSQEAFDRIISQLMEQNATGNAPGPAPQDAIAALPTRKITINDLGSDGKAECSICMDEVAVGDEVTMLPCTHWFHDACVGMWLGEHNTCPHCRKGIPSAAPGDARARPEASRTASSDTTFAPSATSPPGAFPTTPPRTNFQPPGLTPQYSPRNSAPGTPWVPPFPTHPYHPLHQQQQQRAHEQAQQQMFQQHQQFLQQVHQHPQAHQEAHQQQQGQQQQRPRSQHTRSSSERSQRSQNDQQNDGGGGISGRIRGLFGGGSSGPRS